MTVNYIGWSFLNSIYNTKTAIVRHYCISSDVTMIIIMIIIRVERSFGRPTWQHDSPLMGFVERGRRRNLEATAKAQEQERLEARAETLAWDARRRPTIHFKDPISVLLNYQMFLTTSMPQTPAPTWSDPLAYAWCRGFSCVGCFSLHCTACAQSYSHIKVDYLRFGSKASRIILVSWATV